MTTQTQTDALEDLYSFRNRAEIMAFLDRNPALVPLLQVVYTKLRVYFLVESIALTFRADPDTPAFDVLEADVVVYGDETEACGRLQRFQASLGQSLYRWGQGRIFVDVESVDNDSEISLGELS